MNTIRKVLELLAPAERRRAMWLLMFILLMALVDVVGIASIMPFMTVLSEPALIDRNEHFRQVFVALGFQRKEDFLFFLGLVVFGMLVLSIVVKGVTTWAILRFTHLQSYSLARRLVAAYLGQPYEWFLNRNSAELSKAVLAEVQQVVNGSVMPLMQFIAQGAVVVAILALLVMVNPGVAIGTGVVFGALYGVIYWILRKRLSALGLLRNKANSVRFKTLSEVFGGIKDVKLGGYEEVFLKKYDEQAKVFASTQSSAAIAGQMPKFALEAIAFGGVIAICLYLIRSDGGIQGALPMLALYAFAGYRVLPALQQTYAQLALLKFSDKALDTLHRDLRSAESSLPKAAPPLGLEFKEAVEFDKVGYAYPGQAGLAIDSLSLCVPASSTVGLVGSTGSGKTTTVDILLGLLSPSSGSVRVDGVPLDAQRLRAWQGLIGYVPQHIYLTDDTVAANIAFGIQQGGQIDRDAMVQAARAAQIHDFIVNELPKGYETEIGERGVRLSGGQRQRIGIARALYRRPRVLILDEATSALDTITERAVMEEIRKMSGDLTVVHIAHRLSTVRRCDRIYVMKSGACVASGSFDELSLSSEDFRRMVAAGDVEDNLREFDNE